MSGEPPPADAAEPVAVAGNGEPVEVQDPASVPIEGTDQAGATPDEELKEDFSHLPDAERLGLDYTITSTIVAEYEGDMVEDQYGLHCLALARSTTFGTGTMARGRPSLRTVQCTPASSKKGLWTARGHTSGRTKRSTRVTSR